jgi:hypothetical protein
VLNVIFPYLISTKQEFVKMKIDGEGYHNSVIDLIQNHKQKGYKTAASFLLVKLCEKFDGLSTYVVNFCLQLLDYCMNGSVNENLKNYSLLNLQNMNSESSAGVQKILTSFSAEIQIDTSLMILLILNTNVGKNPTAMALFRIILETHVEKFLNVNSQIIRDKLCLIYGTFLDDLYNTEEVESFYKHIYSVIEFLFNQIFSFRDNPGIAYQAAYALNQLIYYKDYTDVVTNIVRKIMPK